MLEVNGHARTERLRPSLRTLCETLRQRGDPGLAFDAKVDLVF